MLARISTEVKRWLRDARYLSSFLTAADLLVLMSAILMLLGVFLPWVSADGLLTATGLMGGGDLHFILALLAIHQVYQVSRLHIRAQRSRGHHALLNRRLQRIAFYYLLVGVVSIMASVFTLLTFGSQSTVINGIVDIRFGFYLTACSGLLIFFGGLERFRR